MTRAPAKANGAFGDAGLKSIWEESFSTAWRLALKEVRQDYPQVTFPDVWSYPNDIESMLDCNFWE